ncbi:MAG: ABC transporter ATP-binding protein/permease [Candidatus Nomurabacteria bacterium]|jgi:ATP-binding cassette subfamily B protein|nr:ABC transporter ATP-binding protein/permease [Candidatus Nomurabacteria bacterium]
MVKRVFYYFWRALMRHKFLAIALLLLVPVNVLLGRIFVPIGTSEMIGKLSSGNFEFAEYIPLLIFTIGAAAIQNLFLVRVADWIDWSLDAKGGFYLANLSFDKIIQQSMTFHNNRFSGSLTSQANKLPAAFTRLKSTFVWNLYPLIMMVILTVGAVWFISPIYALILLGAVVLYAIIATVTFVKTRHVDAKLATAENKQTGQLADSITNILSVKSYARENHEKKRFARVAEKTKGATYGVAKVSMWRNFSLNIVNTGAFVVLLILIINGHSLFGFTVANVVLLYTLTSQLLSEMWTLNHVLRDFNRAIGDAKEMVEILDEPLTVEDQSEKELAVKSAEIDFHNITFKHAEQREAIFKEFNLKMAPGERIGLVGISGSGKTTLTKLLLRFADVDEGQILVDGQDISMVTQDSLRRMVAYVPQETSLFHRSIAENIAYGKPGASIEEIKKAAKLANAHDFVKELPEGYETLVGERGVKLSGGQRQRVAIARAILKDAPILVLDEATSALDSESEELIQEALGELMKGRTSLVIAHRLSTVASLDRIVVLKDGRIIEQGTHRQLVMRGGEYAKLWSRQSGAFLEEDDE